MVRGHLAVALGIRSWTDAVARSILSIRKPANLNVMLLRGLILVRSVARILNAEMNQMLQASSVTAAMRKFPD